MSFTNSNLKNERYMPLHFYLGADIAVASALSDSLTWSRRFKIGELKIHFSGAFPSVNSLVVYVSAALGSDYNHRYLNEPLNGVQDLLLQWDPPLILNSGDHLIIQTSTLSAAVSFGMEVNGWGIIGGE